MIAKLTIQLKNSSGRTGKLCGVGIGCPGQSKNGVLVGTANFPLCWNVPLAALVSEQLEDIPVVLLNDADAAVAAEVWGNVSRDQYHGLKNIAVVTLGTGVGLGLVLNGVLYQGSNGLIEGGHMIIQTVDGGSGTSSSDNAFKCRPCGCGQAACVETYASARSVAVRYAEASQRAAGDGAAASASVPLVVADAKAVFDRAAKGDLVAEGVIDEVGR